MRWLAPSRPAATVGTDQRGAQFDTVRLRLIKIAARVVEMKTMIRVHLPTSCPVQDGHESVSFIRMRREQALAARRRLLDRMPVTGDILRG
jgi:hypothetical protein